MADLGLPHLRMDQAPREGHRHDQRFAVHFHRGNRQLIAGMGMVAGHLLALGVDRLDKVTVLVQQTNGNERQPEVAGRFAVVAGQDAQTAGIDREALVKPKFGAEISHQMMGRVQQFGHFRARFRLKIGVVTTQYPSVFGEKGPILRRLIQAFLSDPAQEQFRVVLDFAPQFGVDPGIQTAHAVVPAVEQVVGQLVQPLQVVRDAWPGFEPVFRCLGHDTCLLPSSPAIR